MWQNSIVVAQFLNLPTKRHDGEIAATTTTTRDTATIPTFPTYLNFLSPPVQKLKGLEPATYYQVYPMSTQTLQVDLNVLSVHHIIMEPPRDKLIFI